MTSGIEDIANGDGVSPSNLKYSCWRTRWAYHNVYVKLQDVIAQTSDKTWSNYFKLQRQNRDWMVAGSLLTTIAFILAQQRVWLDLDCVNNNGKWENAIINENYYKQPQLPHKR
jgi:hypothetical protein